MKCDNSDKLTDIISWTVDIEYKRWLVTEYLNTQPYSNRLQLILSLIHKYYENFFKNNHKIENGITLNNHKFLKTIVKEYLHKRWQNFDDDSKLDPLIMLKISYEFCNTFKNITDIKLAYSIFYSLFTGDKSAEKFSSSSDIEKKTDIYFILITALSYPCYNLLEAGAFYVNQAGYNRSSIEFRLGSRVLHEVCHLIPNGFQLLVDLPKVAPNFSFYLVYAFSKKLSNKLRSYSSITTSLSSKSSEVATQKFDSFPSKTALKITVHYFKNYRSLFLDKPSTDPIILPDINTGDTRAFINFNISPIEDLIYLSLGYGLWLQSAKNHSECREYTSLFEEYHAALLDILILFDLSEKPEKDEKTEIEEGEEIELGELVDDVEDTSDKQKSANESAFPFTRYLNFINRVASFPNISKQIVVDSLSRFAQILIAINKGSRSILLPDFENIKSYNQSFPKCQLLDEVISHIQNSFNT